MLFWSGEDSVEKGLMPRFMAMGGDLSRIGAVDVVKEDGKKRRFDPASDTDLLREALEGQRRRGEPVSLIVIDPFIVIAKTDSNKNAETRRDMQPLVEFGEGVRCRDPRGNALHEGDAEAGRQRARHGVARVRRAGAGDIRRRRPGRRGGGERPEAFADKDEVKLRPERRRVRLRHRGDGGRRLEQADRMHDREVGRRDQRPGPAAR